MKDFRDLLTLARRSHFDGTIITRTVRATFERRNADLGDVAEVLDPEFFEDAALGRRWQTYCRTNAFEDAIASSFPAVGVELRRFLQPLADALHGGEPPTAWNPSSGWTEA